jgi:hypothetical protein
MLDTVVLMNVLDSTVADEAVARNYNEMKQTILRHGNLLQFISRLELLIHVIGLFSRHFMFLPIMLL